jgi:hypothetical protein
MSTQRIVIHLVSVALLLIWGGVMLYFYASGRIVNYLPPLSEGWFRPMALAGGIGLIILGIFNLATMGSDDAGCDDCGHDHDTHHGHDHAPTHQHGHDCCGHDHHHDHHHDHSHAHGHQHEHHDHAHGILEESGALGRTVAILILGVPIVVAAALTPDRFSARAVINKGLYSPNYSDTSRADQFSLRKADGQKTGSAMKDQPPSADDTAPGTMVDALGLPVETPPDGAPTAGAKAGSDAPAAAAQSYGTFTLEDLKQQVPMSSDGNFILEVPELFYTAGDLEVQKVLAGQTIETTAQVLPEQVNNEEGKRLRVFRMLVQCCAADARPFSVPVEFEEKAPEFMGMTWIKVVGKMDYRQESGQTVPVIMATKVEETTEPESSLMY